MALNFPANTSLPYIDPVSGLKYVFNEAVGGWEAAIQPPAIVSPAVPALTIPGFLWWDSEGGSLYIYYQDQDSAQWVEAVPTAGQNSAIAKYGLTPPNEALDGELWWSTVTGNMYLYYDDGDSTQWIQTNTYGLDGPTLAGVNLTSSASAPSDAKANDLWYNTTDSTLYINYKTSDVANWVKSHNISDFNPVTSVTGVLPINVSSGTTPVVSVNDATTVQSGVVKLADINSSSNKDQDTVLTPRILSETIGTYIPTGSDSVKGLMQFANKVEVESGIIGNKAVSPHTLKESISSLSNVPIGAIIQHARTSTPPGYLPCDGSAVSRTTYYNLFRQIGITYGIGDGGATFNVPNISGSPSSIIKF